MAKISRRLEFDLGQGWARGISLVFATEAESARIDRTSTLRVEQFHSRLVLDVDLSANRDSLQGKADGLIAGGQAFKDSRRVLMVKSADCAPLIYIDRESQAVAAIHAGWRGLAQGVHLVPFERGFDPRSTWVWIGPCLNGESFEVGDDMRAHFPADKNDTKFFAPGKASDKRYFHAWKFLERDFARAGVELVYNVEVDTFLDPDFASYRRGLREGRQLTQHNYSWVGWGEPALNP